MIFMLFIQAFLEDRSSHLEVQKFGSSSTTRTVGTNVEKKVVSVRTSVDPKATAAERVLMIVLSWPQMHQIATNTCASGGRLKVVSKFETHELI